MKIFTSSIVPAVLVFGALVMLAPAAFVSAGGENSSSNSNTNINTNTNVNVNSNTNSASAGALFDMPTAWQNLQLTVGNMGTMVGDMLHVHTDLPAVSTNVNTNTNSNVNVNTNVNGAGASAVIESNIGQSQTYTNDNSNQNVNVNVNNNGTQPIPVPVYTYPTYPTYPTSPLPSCWLQATPTIVSPGQYVRLYWNSTNTNSGFISGYGQVAPNGTAMVLPNQPTTYVATFTGFNGQTATCSATVTAQGVVYAPAPIVPVVSAPVPMPVDTAPYVTLSQVPYTGLDLGPVGTALYWGTMVLAAALGGYLIVIKRVQNGLATSIGTMLFSDADTGEESEPEGTPEPETAPEPQAEPEDAIDAFVRAQVFHNA